MKTIVLFFLATLVATSHATCLSNPIRLLGDTALEDCIPNPLQFLQKTSRSGGLSARQTSCLSWRLTVETNNLQKWSAIPKNCITYVGNYMQGKQYPRDCNAVANIAIEYAESITPAGDGKDIWVFDVAETALSNLPYYARPDVQFGSFPYNSTKFNEWVAEGQAPAVPAVLRLYQKLCELGFNVVFITGSHEYQREVLASNLKNVGYTTWEKFILKGEGDKGLSATAYKSKKRRELVEEGYTIIGNVGDQWSDLTEEDVGSRTFSRSFKVPNPMYYVG